MDRAANSLEIKLERLIQASPEAAYDAWLDPQVPGTPWNAAAKLVMDSKVDGLFYARMNNTPHYGRFTAMVRGKELQHSWMSPYTEGQESIVTVAFAKSGNDTLMTLVHTGLPNNSNGMAHQEGWTFFMDKFPQRFAARQ